MSTTKCREELVKKLISQQAHWVLGGWENSITDGHQTEMPSRDNLAFEIYTEVMNARGVEVAGGIVPTKRDIRFLTRARIEEMIDQCLTRFQEKGYYNPEFKGL